MPSAGEVEQFAYCAHNWWLARKGTDPHDQSHRGVELHHALGDRLRETEQEKKEYRRALAWAFRFLAVAASLTVLTLEVLYLRQSPQHFLFLSLALVLLASSGGLLVIALTAQESYQARQRTSGLVPGHVVDSDLGGAGTLLSDARLGLNGRPDYVLQTPEGRVPVEIKSGHTPDRPFASHVLQVGCYLQLLETATGKAPPYGLLTYPKGTFRVAWDDGLRGELQSVLNRMGAAVEAGRADRDHDQPGRCRGCARRAVCDQRLA